MDAVYISNKAPKELHSPSLGALYRHFQVLFHKRFCHDLWQSEKGQSLGCKVNFYLCQGFILEI